MNVALSMPVLIGLIAVELAFDFLTGLQASDLGQTARLDGADDRAHLLTAKHGHQPEEHQGQGEVGCRPSRYDGEALLDGLAIEGLLGQLRRHNHWTHPHIPGGGNTGCAHHKFRPSISSTFSDLNSA